MIYTPPLPPRNDMAVVEVVDSTFSTSSLIYALWGKTDGEKMMRIFECESGMKQWNKDGSVVVSKTNDIGIGQVNLETWQDEAKSRGFDLSKTVDNLKMSYIIWIKSGFKAWTCNKIVEVV